MLLFVEVLNLVQIQKHAVRRQKRIKLRVDLLDIAGRRCRGVELAELAVRTLRDDVGDRGLARAGRTVENHIRNLAGIDNPAQKPVFSENVRLTAHIVEILRSERVCQRLIHASASF